MTADGLRPRLERLAGRLRGVLGMPADPPPGEDPARKELERIVRRSREQGAFNDSGTKMLAGMIEFRSKRVRDVMRPRTEVVALPLESTEEEVRDVLRRERYSRYPVYKDSLDDVVGMFLAKDLWLKEPGGEFSLARYVRATLFVPDTRPAERVLDDLRKTRAHLAVVLDEYGGTAGIVTLEDLVEEVIGDINDEYDVAPKTAIETNGVLELAGSLTLADVRAEHHLSIPEGEWTTIGGYAFSRLGRLPRIGDRAEFPGGQLEVVAMEGRRVAAVRVHRLEEMGSASAR